MSVNGFKQKNNLIFNLILGFDFNKKFGLEHQLF